MQLCMQPWQLCMPMQVCHFSIKNKNSCIYSVIQEIFVKKKPSLSKTVASCEKPWVWPAVWRARSWRPARCQNSEESWCIPTLSSDRWWDQSSNAGGSELLISLWAFVISQLQYILTCIIFKSTLFLLCNLILITSYFLQATLQDISHRAKNDWWLNINSF